MTEHTWRQSWSPGPFQLCPVSGVLSCEHGRGTRVTQSCSEAQWKCELGCESCLTGQNLPKYGTG